MVQMHALQQANKTDELYHCWCNATVHINKTAVNTPTNFADGHKANHVEEADLTWQTAREVSEASGLTIQVPHNAHVPLAIDLKDYVAYQCFWVHDLIWTAFLLYDDQEIIFDRHMPIDILEKWWLHWHSIIQNQLPEDPLINHAQNMLVYPDVYYLMDTFCGLPKAMWIRVLSKGFTPESNTIKDFVAEEKGLKLAQQTVDHYNWQTHLSEGDIDNSDGLNVEDHKPQKISVTITKELQVNKAPGRMRAWIFINTKETHYEGRLTLEY